MVDYSPEKLSAYEMILAKGVGITIKFATAGTYSPVSDSSSNATWTNVSHYGVISEYKEQVIDNTLIRSGDKKVIISAYGLTNILHEGDKILIDGEEHNVINPNPVAPSNDPIIYKAQVRR